MLAKSADFWVLGGRWADFWQSPINFQDLGVISFQDLGVGGRIFCKVRGFPGFGGRWAEFWRSPGISRVRGSVGGTLAKFGDFQALGGRWAEFSATSEDFRDLEVGGWIFGKVRGLPGFGGR